MSEPRAVSPAHVILIGLPGAGKSSHGRIVARHCGRPFIDLDRRVALRAGRSIPQLFREVGEEGFRTIEREATAALADEPPSIVAPGGGWMMDPGNVALVKPGATIIWLQVSPLLAVRRMGARVRSRPLLRTVDPVAALQTLLEARAPRYATADTAIDTEALDWQGVAAAILARF